jgi:hypothetical protein
METAVDGFLEGRTVDAEKALLAGSLRVLARKLDAVGAASSVGAATATPALARQFAETLRELQFGESGVAVDDLLRQLAWLRPQES